MKRRKFLKVGGSLASIPLLTGFYSWQIEPFWLEFVHRSLPFRGLPLAFKGKTVMQISDMHVGNRFPMKFLESSLQSAAKYHPDIVTYTGDFVSYESREQLVQLRKVLKFAVKGQLATIAVLGNHDYGHNWGQSDVADDIVNILEESGIMVLRNEAIEVDGFSVVGLDDFWGTNYDPGKILNELSTEKSHLFLCHNPDVADEPIWSERKGWILSGHTHGGQVKPPFLKPPILPVKNKLYTAGNFEVGPDLNLYINRALGHLWQVRFNVRPEITIFTLNQI